MVSKPHKISLSDNGRSWWVVFRAANSKAIRRMTREGFGHCFVLTRMNNITMIIDPTLGTVNHILTEAPLPEILAEQKLAGYRVVHFRYAAQEKRLKARSPIITCSSYIAYTMGISFFGISPYQLYKKIIRMGGEEI